MAILNSYVKLPEANIYDWEFMRVNSLSSSAEWLKMGYMPKTGNLMGVWHVKDSSTEAEPNLIDLGFWWIRSEISHTGYNQIPSIHTVNSMKSCNLATSPLAVHALGFDLHHRQGSREWLWRFIFKNIITMELKNELLLDKAATKLVYRSGLLPL
jgi:hypothetical protein